jgi:hypothetical protein
LNAPDRPTPYAHPAQLILTLSLALTVGIGIGRFAYSLVLPDMRDSLHWSYSAAGFMNTVNAAGLATAIVLSMNAKGAILDLRSFGRAARRVGAGVRRCLLCRGRFDDGLCALQLPSGCVADRDRGDDHCFWRRLSNGRRQIENTHI